MKFLKIISKYSVENLRLLHVPILSLVSNFDNMMGCNLSYNGRQIHVATPLSWSIDNASSYTAVL